VEFGQRAETVNVFDEPGVVRQYKLTIQPGTDLRADSIADSDTVGPGLNLGNDELFGIFHDDIKSDLNGFGFINEIQACFRNAPEGGVFGHGTFYPADDRILFAASRSVFFDLPEAIGQSLVILDPENSDLSDSFDINILSNIGQIVLGIYDLQAVCLGLCVRVRHHRHPVDGKCIKTSPRRI